MDRRLVSYGILAGLVFGAAAYLGRNNDKAQPAQESDGSNPQPYVDKTENHYHYHGDETPTEKQNDPNPQPNSQDDPEPEEDPQGDDPEDPPAEPETIDDNPGEED